MIRSYLCVFRDGRTDSMDAESFEEVLERLGGEEDLWLVIWD